MATAKSSKKHTRRRLKAGAFGLLAVTLLFFLVRFCSQSQPKDAFVDGGEAVDPGSLYGFSLADFAPTRHVVKEGQAFGQVMDELGVPYPKVANLLSLSKDVFNPRRWRAGDAYWVFRTADSSAAAHYFIYESSQTEYLIFGLDSLYVEAVERPTKIVQRAVAGSIESSLYETLADQNVSPAVAVRLSEVYAWTIDFFRLQKGDRFEVIFEERYVDDTSFVGTGRILGARFVHNNKPYYAFRFEDEASGIRDFYSEEGEGLKRMSLKAPLEFARITSRYSKNRFHPVQKRWKAHLGTDYAAPTGTPILATAGGQVIAATYTSANGNYVKIRHNGTYTTQYLHMSRIAKGMRPGTRVEQGQVIGYVGSTGLATGPHVCYRFWKNGKQVDPLREPMQRTEPLPAKLWASYEAQMKPLKAQIDALAAMAE
jgi:murein DD-endopeptidase MepM/ murein hydrolase activator NlpD